MFAIAMFDKKKVVRAICLNDRDCGFIMCQQYRPENGVMGAHMFATRAEADKIYNQMRDAPVNRYTDGSTTPPMHIWSGLQICKANPKDEGDFVIVELTATVVHSEHVEGELTGPKNN